MRIGYIRGLALVLLALGAATARPRAAVVADYTLGGVGCTAAATNFDVYCFGSFAFQPYQTAVANLTHFGAGGVVPVTAETVALNTFSDADLAAIDGLVVPWWADPDAPAADVDRIRTFFLNGGDLFILADDQGHDPVNDALGIPSIASNSIGLRTITGTAPLFAGPFGPVAAARQYFTVGKLDPATVIMRGGRVVSTDDAGEVTGAVWDENDYAPGAGRLVIITDVDTAVSPNTAFAPLNDDGRFILNATAFLIAGGTIDAFVYDLIGVPSCNITPNGFGYCGVNTVFFGLRTEAAKSQNFGPGGAVERRVAFVEFDAFTPELAARLKAVVIPWIQQLPVDDSASYRDAVIAWFRAGGNLWLLQDDFFHDPIGEALGIPTPFADGGQRFTNGVAPTYDGPFGVATNVQQVGTIGGLDAADVTNNGGTVTGTATPDIAVVATWRQNQYAPSAGRLVVATDVDMAFLGFGQPDANRIWSLNTLAYVMASDATAPVVDCDVSQRTLWPPNGRTSHVVVSGEATDDESGLTAGSYTVTDEYGNTIPGGALVLGADGSFSFSVPLVASRLGEDVSGRLYTIEITTTDSSGNIGSCTTTVTAPHDKGKS